MKQTLKRLWQVKWQLLAILILAPFVLVLTLVGDAITDSAEWLQKKCDKIADTAPPLT